MWDCKKRSETVSGTYGSWIFLTLYEKTEEMVFILAKRTMLLLSQRLAYGGESLHHLQVGMHNGPEYLVVCHFSATLAELFWALQLPSMEHRRAKLLNMDVSTIPAPMYHFLCLRITLLNQFVIRESRPLPNCWAIGPTRQVTKVGNTIVDDQSAP